MVAAKSVFISYRRSFVYTALAVYKDLHEHGYDVFFDYTSIDSGAFDRIILNQIAARAHFVLILTAGALDRCQEPGDWLRQEIEQAIDLKRNIIPLIFDGFDLREQRPKLTGKLAMLTKYNGLEIPKSVIYFETAMQHLRDRFLSKMPEGVLHPTPAADEPVVRRKIATTQQLIQPSKQQINVEEYLAEGLKHFKEQNYDAAIAEFTEAIWLNPRLTKMYIYRATCRTMKGEYDEAVFDADEALKLEPENARAYVERGVAYYWKHNFDQAIHDLNRAIQLDAKLRKPLSAQLAELYLMRATYYRGREEYLKAIADYSDALRYGANPADIYYQRAMMYRKTQNLSAALNDLTLVIMLTPSNREAYYHRGMTYQKQGDLKSANYDYEEYINRGGENADMVRQWIKENEQQSGKTDRLK